MAVGVHVAPDAVDDRVVVRDAAVGIEAQYLARIGGMIAASSSALVGIRWASMGLQTFAP